VEEVVRMTNPFERKMGEWMMDEDDRKLRKGIQNLIINLLEIIVTNRLIPHDNSNDS